MPLWNKDILGQTKGDLWRKNYLRQLWNVLDKTDKTEINWKEYKNQRDLSVNLLKKSQKNHFGDLNESSVPDDKKFWQIVKPPFSNKLKAKKL